jgi:hypothetical protein
MAAYPWDCLAIRGVLLTAPIQNKNRGLKLERAGSDANRAAWTVSQKSYEMILLWFWPQAGSDFVFRSFSFLSNFRGAAVRDAELLSVGRCRIILTLSWLVVRLARRAW